MPTGVEPTLAEQIAAVNQAQESPIPVSNPPDPEVPQTQSDQIAAVDTAYQASQVPVEQSLSAGETVAVPVADINTSPNELPIDDESSWGVVTPAQQAFSDQYNGNDNTNSDSGYVGAQVGQAQAQQSKSDLAQFPTNTDWRVTLRLAPGATYLYNAPAAGLLAPLKTTNGIIFPYTPTITTAYKANYSNYDLTHSNYRGYFYQNSYTDAITLNATFTAQSTSDAAYVLAVIHFFRSATKMFYGQDAQRGSPPPLVFLSGLGDYQFNNHPCLVQSFNYNLPADVDYISSGTPNNLGLNLQPLQNLYSTTLNAISPTVTRLANAFLPPGAQNTLAQTTGIDLLSNPTYVPSYLDMVITLLPVQSRQQVSQQFSLKGFANGSLLKGGFW